MKLENSHYIIQRQSISFNWYENYYHKVKLFYFQILNHLLQVYSDANFKTNLDYLRNDLIEKLN
jgi:hypothetical protein